MARIRSIKPELWADQGLAEVCRDARLLYIGMFNFADDYGRMRGSPMLIRAEVFPYDADLDVASLLDVLASPREGGKPGFIQRYESAGESYIWIRKFTKHQKIDHPSKPQFPEPPPDVTETLASPREPSRALPEPSRKKTLEQGAGNREQGKEEEGGKPETAPAVPQPAAMLILLPEKPASPLREYMAIEFPQARANAEWEAAQLEACPGVDLLAQAKAARAWELSNPTLVKTQKRRFLGNWFARAQNGVRRGDAPASRGAASLHLSPKLEGETAGRKFV